MKLGLIIIFLLLLVLFYNIQINEYFSTDIVIPKIIWTFWDDTENKYLDTYINNWKQMCPQYKINILNKNNYKDYIDVDIYKLKHADSPSRISDFIRLNILSKYGGIWLDATIFLSKSLDWIYDYKKDFIAYYKDDNTTNCKYKCIENWFFACVPEHKFVKLWCEEFMKINDYNTINDYITFIKNQNVDLQRIDDYIYLTCYVTCQYILQKKLTVNEVNNLALLRLEDNDWSRYKLYSDRKKELCTDSINSYQNIFKLTRFERKYIEANPDLLCIYDKFKDKKIPKIIWTFWNGDDNRYLEICRKTWIVHCKDYEINILTKENINKFVNIDMFKLKHSDNIARISDFIRLYILSKYGGIWLDAYTLLPRSLDWIYDIDSDFIAYYRDASTTKQEYKCIENWFIACSPKNEFVTLWYNEFMRINDYNTIDDYVQFVKDQNVDLQNINDYHYLTCYVSCQYLMQKLITNKDIIKKLYLIRMEDHDKYLNSVEVKEILCNDDIKHLPNIIKFTRWNRQYMKDNPKLYCIYDRFDIQ